MHLKINHTTVYTYDQPVDYALQQLRLIPRSGHGQRVLEWNSTVTGGTKQLAFDDQFTNRVELVQMDEGASMIRIVSHGDVVTEDRNGIVGKHKGYAPLWLFESATEITRPGRQIEALAREFGDGDKDMLEGLHALSAAVLERVRYETGHTDSRTTAEDALKAGRGVCQDHAHIMIATARAMGRPARYVSGYLMMDETDEQDASHAWAEIWVDDIGWIGFDAANGICPDDRYVRVAVGRDYRDAAPVHGLRTSATGETLSVSLHVQQ